MRDKPFLALGIFLLIAVLIFFGVKSINKAINSVEDKYDKSYKNYKVVDNTLIDEVYDNHFNEISITATTSDISIMNSQDDKISLKIYAKEDSATISTEEDKLVIKVKEESCIGFCFNQTKGRIEISIPENYENIIKLTVDYGDIDIAKYEFATFDIDVSSGDISIIEANNLTIDSDYGDIAINTASNLTIDKDYGDIEIETLNDYCNITNNFGNITINNLNLTASSQIEANFGDIIIDKTNSINIVADTNLGDEKVKNNNPDSNITLTINNDFGDIRVNY